MNVASVGGAPVYQAPINPPPPVPDASAAPVDGSSDGGDAGDSSGDGSATDAAAPPPAKSATPAQVGSQIDIFC